MADAGNAASPTRAGALNDTASQNSKRSVLSRFADNFPRYEVCDLCGKRPGVFGIKGFGIIGASHRDRCLARRTAAQAGGRADQPGRGTEANAWAMRPSVGTWCQPVVTFDPERAAQEMKSKVPKGPDFRSVSANGWATIHSRFDPKVPRPQFAQSSAKAVAKAPADAKAPASAGPDFRSASRAGWAAIHARFDPKVPQVMQPTPEAQNEEPKDDKGEAEPAASGPESEADPGAPASGSQQGNKQKKNSKKKNGGRR